MDKKDKVKKAKKWKLVCPQCRQQYDVRKPYYDQVHSASLKKPKKKDPCFRCGTALITEKDFVKRQGDRRVSKTLMGGIHSKPVEKPEQPGHDTRKRRGLPDAK